jgi:hypothetical protein
MEKLTEPTKLKAATTYNAAADHFDDGPLAFWDRYGQRTIERLRLKSRSYSTLVAGAVPRPFLPGKLLGRTVASSAWTWRTGC